MESRSRSGSVDKSYGEPSFSPGHSPRGQVPDGVEFCKYLGEGVAIGYDKAEMKVRLYHNKQPIAYVKIDEKAPRLLLHTGTEQGAVGGQGHMSALFPEALKVVHKYYAHSAFHSIEMGAAPGAATKGLIDQLVTLRDRVQPSGTNVTHNPNNPLQDIRTDWTDQEWDQYNQAKAQSRNFMTVADQLQKERKLSQAFKKKSPSEHLSNFFKSKEKHIQEATDRVYAWNPELMLETANRLEAIRRMEQVDSTGLQVVGASSATNIIGRLYDGLQDGDAFDWYDKSANQPTPQGTFHVILPIASLERYIRALR